MVLDADTGAIVANLPIGGGVDAIALDLEHRRAFVACSEGVITVVGWTDLKHYEVLATVPTQRGARTIGYDPKRDRIYLPSAQYGAPPPATAAVPHPRPPIVPGTFGLLVIEPQRG
jgi:hypothetical protein